MALGGHDRVALVADARASLPDIPGPRDVIRVDVTRRDSVPFTVLVPYVREGQAVRLLPGAMEVAPPRTGMDAPIPPEAGTTPEVAIPPDGQRAPDAPIPPEAGTTPEVAIPPDGRDGMRE